MQSFYVLHPVESQPEPISGKRWLLLIRIATGLFYIAAFYLALVFGGGL